MPNFSKTFCWASVPTRPNFFGSLKTTGRLFGAGHGARLARSDVDDVVLDRLRLAGVGEAAQPAERLVAVREASVPPLAGSEVGQVRVRITAAVDDGQLAVFEQPFEARHRRMEREAVVELDRVVGLDGERRAGFVVSIVRPGHDRVEAVVATAQFEHDQNAVGILLRPSAPWPRGSSS